MNTQPSSANNILILLAVASVVWLIITLLLLVMPGDPNQYYKLFRHEDKAVHFTLFFMLGFLWMDFLAHCKVKGSYIIVCGAGIVLAFVTEAIQHYIPYRSPDLFDVIADTIGIVVALIFYKWHEKTTDSFYKKLKDAIYLNFVRL